MPSPIEDYAIIGDLHTAALVARDGSMDWLCLPRFDSGAAFAALLGKSEHGRWRLAPTGEVQRTTRRYRDDTLILETEFVTGSGAVRLIDFMPPRSDDPTVIRVVEGIRGRVEMSMELIIRFDYGSVVPWVQNVDGVLWAVGGPDSVWLRSPVPTSGRDLTTSATFTVAAGERVPFTFTWRESHRPRAPRPLDVDGTLEDTESWWRRWARRCDYQGPWRDQVMRSLITLKALIYRPTGGILAAATTSLPEQLGGVRNWDYRLCWIRDATFTLYALHLGGYRAEAEAWRDWLLRAAAGHPEQLQIVYGVAGERRLPEAELPWLPGYEGSRPVRVGNEASEQFQLDVYGELMDAMHQARSQGIEPEEASWDLQKVLMESLESRWAEPDQGIWEVRGPRRHFTHSKVMAWVAADRAVKAVQRSGLSGPVERWVDLRDTIHEEVCRRGFDTERDTFTQYYGSTTLDASLLMVPLVGFLPASDPRVVGTVEAVQRYLVRDGLVMRYQQDTTDVDGLPGVEGTFLPCSFWLADNLWMMGRHGQAESLFAHLLGLGNDVGLYSEEYEPQAGRPLGNFPQAFTHVSLVNTALNLSGRAGPSHHRSRS